MPPVKFSFRSCLIIAIIVIFGIGVAGWAASEYLDWDIPFWSTSEVSTPTSNDEEPEGTVKVIDSKGTLILYNHVKTETGPECDKEAHYHAIQGGEAQTLDGKMVKDPGGCGYGKVKDTPIREMSY